MDIKGKIGDLADHNYFLGNLRYLLFRLQKYNGYRQNEKELLKRENGTFDNRYAKLLSLEGFYYGQRCFIIATGPSLKISDLELLRNEITFGVNSICKVFSMTDWRPTFFWYTGQVCVSET